MAAALRLAVAVTCALVLASACQGLELGYYKKSCPRVEHIVRAEVKKFVYKSAGIGAGLIRMLFHDCFVQGCDGSVLLDPTPANPQPEKLSPPNFLSLRGFEVIDAAKDAVEKACPGTVSCADIVAFAARDAAYFLSRFYVKIDMPSGRLDGRVSNASEALANLPPPVFNVTDLVGSFAAKGLDAEDMVVLSGAHTVGRAHCSSFVPDRLAAPSDIDAGFANLLRRRCPANPTTGKDPTVNQDLVTPNAFDNQYYKNVLAHKVLFTSDAALLTSPETAKMVLDNANIPGWWEAKFKAAFVKMSRMSRVEVKTGKQGEIRKNCRVVNHDHPHRHY
ncbi:peroxidase 2-like [Panicum virgatum]|uniref:peroxidase 2-like n=1 Tax=Panicum virgatum TaxID=38727 RepID=UPI0019D648BB|nr:peroxidase 2-like [Panicum virgatum]